MTFSPFPRMKTLIFVLAFTLALAVAMPQDEVTPASGQEGGGNEGGGHHRGNHPDCPAVKTLLTAKCTDHTNRECFKCVHEGCRPADTQETPNCDTILACVTANVEKC